MRKAFADTLCALAAADQRIVLLTGDLGFGVFDEFQERFPDRFINVGISEQALLDVATGLALNGFRPIAYSIASFLTGRGYEQAKVAVGLHRANVVMVGAGGGYSYSSAGPTHHAPEDLGLMSMIPGMTVLNPGCPSEVAYLLRYAIRLDGPSYMRIGRYGEPEYAPVAPIIDGALRVVRHGAHNAPVAVLATGNTVYDAVEAATEAAIPVWSCHQWKPLDRTMIRGLCLNHERVIVVEDHHPIGGLAMQVANSIRLGPDDEWQEDLVTRKGYDAVAIRREIDKWL